MRAMIVEEGLDMAISLWGLVDRSMTLVKANKEAKAKREAETANPAPAPSV